MIPKKVLWYGKAEPLPKEVTLRAGDLRLCFSQGEIRYIRWRGHEVIRRIYVAIRDRNWGTVPPVFSNLHITAAQDHFQVTFDATNTRDEIDFAWRGTLTGRPDGALSFSMHGKARSTFLRNRIGFCALFPISYASRACQVVHTDTRFDETVFPAEITADQPVRPFQDIQKLVLPIAPGCQAITQFEGDVFEMEDQRNWSDASYKVYGTPLSIPYPVEIPAGLVIHQRVSLSIREDPPTARRAAPAVQRRQGLCEVHRLPSSHPMPAVGLSVASHGLPLSEEEISRLRALRLHHLRVDLGLSQAGLREKMDAAAAQAQSIGADLEAAIFLSGAFREELERLKQACGETHPPLSTWLVYPEQEYLKGGSPIHELVRAARCTLADASPAKFAAGANSDLIFLQRNPPPAAALDGVCVALNPQVHAVDNASVVESLEAQTAVIAHAKRLAGGLPFIASPVTLKPRFNPYATGQRPLPPEHALPPEVDERQMSLFCAGWTAASYAALAQGGAASVTYYETTGWRGVMETQAGSPLPGGFRSIPGGVFPVYHVLADIAEFRGGRCLELAFDQPLQAGGLALCRGQDLAVLVANFTPKPLRVRLPGFGPWVSMRRLDETNVLEAIKTPHGYRINQIIPKSGSQDPVEVDLLPFGVTRLDYLSS